MTRSEHFGEAIRAPWWAPHWRLLNWFAGVTGAAWVRRLIRRKLLWMRPWLGERSEMEGQR